MALKDVDWSQGRTGTMVLVLSTKCLSVEQSSSFYPELLRHRAEHGWQLVAVFREAPEEAAKYMRLHGYSMPWDENPDLKSLGVPATPTLLLVDQKGPLIKRWTGRLSSLAEKEVAEYLGIEQLGLNDRDSLLISRNADFSSFERTAK